MRLLVDGGCDTVTVLPLAERVSAAIDACELSWSATPDEPYPGSGPFDVANPTACILRDQRLGVFPPEDDQDSAEFCALLGLRAPEEERDGTP